MAKSDTSRVIEAAGGLLTRENDGKTKIALVHRPKYDDWTLPKGWREKGESWVETAIREVHEETNCRVKLKEFAGCTCYKLDETPKVVLYWHMTLKKEEKFDASGETDKLLWIDINKAEEQLSYASECDLVGKFRSGNKENE